MNVLSEVEIAAYRSDGVVVPAFGLPTGKLEQLQSLASRLIADNPHKGGDHHDLPIADSRGSAHHTRPLIQIRGRDVSGLDDFPIGHPPPVGAVQRPRSA